jgi:hypothetical protein
MICPFLSGFSELSRAGGEAGQRSNPTHKPSGGPTQLQSPPDFGAARPAGITQRAAIRGRRIGKPWPTTR